MKNKLSYALTLAVIAAMLITSLALADNVVNDVTVGGTDTFTAPGSTTVGYKINTAAAQDPQAGCNASDGSPATITLSVPPGVTASTTSLTFTACNAFQNVTFSSSTSGSYSINVSSISDSGTGNYNNQANFTLHVNAPPPPTNTSPTVSVTGVTNGASYELGSVPTVGCSVTDAEDVNPTATPFLSFITGPLAAYGIGSQTATCSYTDAGGLSDTDSATYTIVDTTDPVVTFVSRTPANGNGWNSGDVTVNWSCSDASGVVSATVSQTVSTEGANQSATGTCTDNAGRTASNTQTGINIDKTAPTISGSASPGANGAGWNNTDVTVSFTCGDSLSGVASCESPQTLTAEGAGQSVTGNAADNAGNTASATVSGINIDKTAPTANATASPAANANGWNNTDVTITFTGSDGLSGIASCSAAVVLSSEGASQSASGTCTDKAGNVSALATASGINIDLTNPLVSLVGGPADGGSYYFGFVPAAPTCDASDALSGVDGSCSVSGYSSAVGSHTVTASATDKAGNSASASVSYKVLAWTLNGFYQPVDMKGVWNTVKGGSTVPFKFEVFAGPTELTDTSVVSSFGASPVACPTNGYVGDAIEFTTTGGTSLRYDAVAGQFVQNWQTPKKPGTCYKVTMTTQDLSTLVAYFILK